MGIIKLKKNTLGDCLMTGVIVAIGLAEACHLAAVFLGLPFSACSRLLGMALGVWLVLGTVLLAAGRRHILTEPGGKRRLDPSEKILYGMLALTVISQLIFIGMGNAIYRKGDMTVETVGSFLAVDGILDLCLNVVDGLVVYPKVIEKRLMSELPFMATENIMMDAVKMGGNRQELHERIRELSMEAGRNVKAEGKENNLLELIAADPAFNMSLEELQKAMDPARYVGRSREQVDAFLRDVIRPVLEENKDLLGVKAEISV